MSRVLADLVSSLPRYARLWWRFVVMAFVREMEYRVNFLVGVLEGIAQLALAVLTFALLYSYTEEIAGWTQAEALMLVGIYRAADGVLSLQVRPNMFRIPEYVARGDLDFYLLRPVSSQFLVSLRWLRLPEAVNVLIGLGLAVYAGERAGVDWSVASMLSAGVLVACSLVILYSIWFASVTLSLWLVKLDQLAWLFYAGWETARYPVNYFKGLVRTLLTFVFPVAFATTFPTEVLLGQFDSRLLLVGVALAAASLFLTHRFWTYALRYYSSASS